MKQIKIVVFLMILYSLFIRVNNVQEETTSSEGLQYSLNSDKVSYSVTGIGSCTESDIVITST